MQNLNTDGRRRGDSKLSVIHIFQLLIERKDFFMELLIQHFILSLIAIVIISVVGISIGISMTFNEKWANFVLSLTNFLYTIPSIALLGFLVTITGIGNKSAITALCMYGALPIIRNTYVGIMEVDPDIIESALGMGTTQKQLMFKIQLPLATPVIMAGFRTMVVMTIALAGIASFIGAGGLGVAIWRGITTNYPEMTLAGSLLVALLAILADGLIGLVEKKVRFGVQSD